MIIAYILAFFYTIIVINLNPSSKQKSETWRNTYVRYFLQYTWLYHKCYTAVPMFSQGKTLYMIHCIVIFKSAIHFVSPPQKIMIAYMHQVVVHCKKPLVRFFKDIDSLYLPEKACTDRRLSLQSICSENEFRLLYLHTTRNTDAEFSKWRNWTNVL